MKTRIFKNFSNFDDLLSKLNINLPKPKSVTLKPDIDYKSVSNLNEFMGMFGKHKEYYSNNSEDYFLYLENFSNFVYESDIKPDVSNIVYLYENKMYNLEPIYLLSLIESLNKFNYYEDNKIWILIESILARTNIVREIDVTMYYIILKAFEYFFINKDTTISAEDIYEIVEYNTINKLKKYDKIKIGEYNLNLIDLYLLFGKNLEGSAELYKNLFEKIILPNIKTISVHKPELITCIYFTAILINDHVCKIEPYLKEIDKIKIPSFKSELDDFTEWCKNKRNF
jgi:hypothetical protein